MQKIQNYINNELLAPVDGEYMDNVNPAWGKVYSLCPSSNEKDVQVAVNAAKAAFEKWSNTPVEERFIIL